jgi:hypothetical protein
MLERIDIVLNLKRIKNFLNFTKIPQKGRKTDSVFESIWKGVFGHTD